jgi:hypothetical protein
MRDAIAFLAPLSSALLILGACSAPPPSNGAATDAGGGGAGAKGTSTASAGGASGTMAGTGGHGGNPAGTSSVSTSTVGSTSGSSTSGGSTSGSSTSGSSTSGSPTSGSSTSGSSTSGSPTSGSSTSGSSTSGSSTSGSSTSGSSTSGSSTSGSSTSGSSTSSAASSSTSASTSGSTSSGGPTILTLGTNVTTLTPSEILVVTAVVTDPQGIAQVVGGTLNDPGGAVYGAFAVSTVSGAYSLTLTWSALETVNPITTPPGGGPRTFEAVFFDQGGRSTTRSFTIQLQCDSPHQSFEICAGVCMDGQNDPNNCGSCGNACTSANPQFVCTSGVCQCPAGLQDCAGKCTNEQNDPNNCGSCGNACASASPQFVCTSGVCQCPAGLQDCAGTCTHLGSDNNNCGACGHACNPSGAATFTCSGGQCVCANAASTDCGGVCAALGSDPKNCGACGHDCSQVGQVPPDAGALFEGQPTEGTPQCNIGKCAALFTGVPVAMGFVTPESCGSFCANLGLSCKASASAYGGYQIYSFPYEISLLDCTSVPPEIYPGCTPPAYCDLVDEACYCTE